MEEKIIRSKVYGSLEEQIESAVKEFRERLEKWKLDKSEEEDLEPMRKVFGDNRKNTPEDVMKANREVEKLEK